MVNKSLKLCKTNENFLKSENERLGKVAEEAEATRLPEKEKEISSLNKKIEAVCTFLAKFFFLFTGIFNIQIYMYEANRRESYTLSSK